jgi:hypothetical protein
MDNTLGEYSGCMVTKCLQRASFGFLCLTLAACVPLAQAQESPSQKPITVTVNGKLIETPLVSPMMVNGRVLVPLRGVLEEFDVEIEWMAEEKIVVARGHGRTVTVPVGGTHGFVNDQPVPLDVSARIVNGRTLVPLRFIAEGLTAYVRWDAAKRTVSVTSRIAD